MSLANQGRLERPITSSRLLDLLKDLIGASIGVQASKPSVSNMAAQKLPASSVEQQATSRGSVGSSPSSKKESVQ